MKKIFFVALMLALAAPCAFSLGLQADVFFGQSNGIDIGIVSGKGKVKSSFGLLVDSHQSKKTQITRTYNSYEGEKNIHKTVLVNDTYFGPFYKFTFTTDIVKLNKLNIGMDASFFATLGYSNEFDIDLGFGFMPAVKLNYRNFDFLAGYRGVLFLTELSQGYNGYKNAGFIGVRYTFQDRETVTQSVQSTPGTDHYPSVNIIPGADISSVE